MCHKIHVVVLFLTFATECTLHALKWRIFHMQLSFLNFILLMTCRIIVL